MKNQDDMIFALYTSCVLVNGEEKDAIYDLQREAYSLIPHSLYYMLTHHKNDTIGAIKYKYRDNAEYIVQYVNFLLEKDYGILCKKEDNIFIPIPDQVITPKLITNALFDYDKSSAYSLAEGIRQLDEMKCENLELRFYDYISIEQLGTILGYAKDTTLRDVEVMVQYGEDFLLDAIIRIRLQNPRMRKITVVNSPADKEQIYDYEDVYIIYTTQDVHDESQCGVVNPWYNLPKTEFYLEARHYNSCLNGKISIDKCGNIKNCPSMHRSWGRIGEQTLSVVANDKDFQKLWLIKKDDIEKCQRCELRYMCHDCRAYIEDYNNIYSKPAKCQYIL